MASLSQAPRLGDLPSPHGTFQEHAAHIAKWPAMLSSKGSRGTCIPRGLSTFLQCAFTAHIDDPVGRVPEAPYPHRTPTVRTDHRVPSRAWLVPLPGGHAGADLHRTLDDTLHLGQGCVQRHLHRGNRLGRLPPVRAEALEPFGPPLRHQPTTKRLDRDGCVLHPLTAVGPVRIRAPLAILARTTPDGERWAPHVLGHVARQALRLRRDVPLLDGGHQAVGRLPATRRDPPGDRVRLTRLAYQAHQVPLPWTTQEI